MDLYIDRNAMPETEENTGESVSFSNVNLMLKGMSVQSISLDNSVMLDSVIKSAEDEAYSSVTFDLKRDDGTIGYDSKLATIRAYGAISSPAARVSNSIGSISSSFAEEIAERNIFSLYIFVSISRRLQISFIRVF